MSARPLLYYITDRTQFAGGEAERRAQLLDKIAEAARFGVDYIQLREKDLSSRELENLARQGVEVIHHAAASANRGSSLEARETSRDKKAEPNRPAFLINSRSDVAIAVDADGVHLRSDDLQPSEVRRIYEASARETGRAVSPIIAVSCHSFEEVLAAQRDGADFVVFGPVFEKKAEPIVAAAGLATLRRMSEAEIPVLALGGVTLENAKDCVAAGAAGIAGIRLFQENKIEEVVQRLRGSLE